MMRARARHGSLVSAGLVLLAILLAGCGADPNIELKQWMDEQA